MSADKKNLYISRSNLFNLLDALRKDYDVYVPVKKGEQRFYKKYLESSEDIAIGGVRAFEPLKAFFSRAREVVAKGFKPDTRFAQDKPLAIVGVKACDLKGMKVQDHVFLNHDYRDPFYIRNREENLIIASDCTLAIETCFCLSLGLNPYAEEDFDINLSETTGGFIAETGSPKGEALVRKYLRLFQDATEQHRKKRENRRKEVVKKVKEQIKKSNVPSQDVFKGIIERNFESGMWDKEAKTCVECGACNTICPTCHCFLLYDQKDKKRMERLKIWDSCMVKDFARVAGGANPRERLWMRLRNRFEKKFDFFPKIADIYACTGCGRCISACPAKIDIRKVLRELVDNA